MTISMENYYLSCDSLDKIKLNDNQYGELLSQLWHYRQDKTEWQSVWRITTSVVTLDKTKLNDNQYGESLLQLWHWTRQNWMTISMDNYYFSCDTGQDKTGWQSVWRIAISVVTPDKKTEWQSLWRITSSDLTLDKVKMNGSCYNGLFTKGEVKMAGYWRSSFFACLWTESWYRICQLHVQNKLRPTSGSLTKQFFSSMNKQLNVKKALFVVHGS